MPAGAPGSPAGRVWRTHRDAPASRCAHRDAGPPPGPAGWPPRWPAATYRGGRELKYSGERAMVDTRPEGTCALEGDPCLALAAWRPESQLESLAWGTSSAPTRATSLPLALGALLLLTPLQPRPRAPIENNASSATRSPIPRCFPGPFRCIVFLCMCLPCNQGVPPLALATCTVPSVRSNASLSARNSALPIFRDRWSKDRAMASR